MATKTADKRRFITGFCNPNNDGASHDRCKKFVGSLTCDCPCHEHEEAPAMVTIPATVEALIEQLEDEYAAQLLAGQDTTRIRAALAIAHALQEVAGG